MNKSKSRRPLRASKTFARITRENFAIFWTTHENFNSKNGQIIRKSSLCSERHSTERILNLITATIGFWRKRLLSKDLQLQTLRLIKKNLAKTPWKRAAFNVTLVLTRGLNLPKMPISMETSSNFHNLSYKPHLLNTKPLNSSYQVVRITLARTQLTKFNAPHLKKRLSQEIFRGRTHKKISATTSNASFLCGKVRK